MVRPPIVAVTPVSALIGSAWSQGAELFEFFGADPPFELTGDDFAPAMGGVGADHPVQGRAVGGDIGAFGGDVGNREWCDRSEHIHLARVGGQTIRHIHVMVVFVDGDSLSRRQTGIRAFGLAEGHHQRPAGIELLDDAFVEGEKVVVAAIDRDLFRFARPL